MNFNKRTKTFGLYILACAVTTLAIIIIVLIANKKGIVLYSNSATIEAGQEFSHTQQIRKYNKLTENQVGYETNLNTNIPGKYYTEYYEISTRKILATLNINVIDTTYPEVILKQDEFTLNAGEKLNTDDIIENVIDATAITVSINYASADLNIPGNYEITLEVTDISGNTTKCPINVVVIEGDTTGPVIEGLTEININAGQAYDYYDVTVSDNEDPNPVLTVDFSSLDINTEGSYIITYTATDSSGNITSVNRTVNVTGTIDFTQVTTSAGSASADILGLTEVSLYVGESFDPLSGVSLSANFDPATQVAYNLDTFDNTVPGTYTVLYAAINLSGEPVYANRTITVMPEPYIYKPEGGTFSFDAAGIPNQPYIVLVNRALCCVTVYEKDSEGNYTVPVKSFACSVGREGHETPTGRYTTSSRYDWCYMVDGSWGRNSIVIWKGIMFHTVCYYTKSIDDLEYDEFNKLGTPASLGCIRLCYADETWLYENCPTGFTAIIYDDYASPGPLGKPETIIIDTTDEETRGWDPTDPANPYIDN